MCTLTVVPVNANPPERGVRVECNRDESRFRPAALPPEFRTFGNRRALLPIDPASDGTWIAVSDAPLVLVLLNVYVAQAGDAVYDILPKRPALVSRGTIIPHALSACNLREVLARVQELDVRRFEPFRMIAIDREHYAEIVWAAEQLSVDTPSRLTEPLFFTSSGLGDDVVAGPRRKLFKEMLADGTDWPAAQDSFHRTVWPGREFASVWMTRPEARTVSVTRIEVGSQNISVDYAARGDDADTAPFTLSQTLAISQQG